MKKTLLTIVVFCIFVVNANAGLITFNNWGANPQTVDNVTYTLNGYSDAFNSAGQVNLFTNSGGNAQLNTWPTTYLLNLSDGDYFEYTIQTASGYEFDWAAMSYNVAAGSSMTTQITAGGNTYSLTQPGNPFIDFGNGITSLTVRNIFTAGQIQGSSHTNSFAVAATPIPGAIWLLGTGVLGLFGLRRKFQG